MSGTTPIGDAQWRQRVRVAGRIKSVRVPSGGATANLECTLVDGSGAILLVFQGRRRIPGIQQGARLVAQGMVGAWEGQLAILNPDYELIAGPDTKEVDVGRLSRFAGRPRQLPCSASRGVGIVGPRSSGERLISRPRPTPGPTYLT